MKTETQPARLRDQAAIITGAGSGMGRAISRLFAREGAKVLIADLKENTVVETRDMITQEGGESLAMKVDMAYPGEIVSMVERAVQTFGKLDILVNNAGMFDESKSVAELDESWWDLVLAVNLKGPFLAAKHALPHMLKNGKGAIVNIASIAGLIGGAGGAAYTVSKHGLVGLTRQMAVAYGPQGIRTNVICPGAIYSGMLPRESLADKSNPFVGKIKSIPAQGAGEAEDIAEAALFLASEAASYIQGQTLVVDGGWIVQA